MNNDNYFLKITENKNSASEKPKHGLHVLNIEVIDGKKYLIKKTNSTSYPNNEVYLTSIVEILAGKEDSVHSLMGYEDDNFDLKNITTESEKSLKVASLWIENTKNLMEAEIDFSIKPKNLVKSMLANLLAGHIEPHAGNIIVDENNKFYAMDPMIRGKNNKYGIDPEDFLTPINNAYKEFLRDLTKNNIKEKTSQLLKKYFELQHEVFLAPILEYCIKNENTKYTNQVQEIVDANKKIIENNSIEKLIDLMSQEDAISEIDQIKQNYEKNKEELKKIGQYFESKEIFKNFGDRGIQPGHMNIVLERLEELSKNYEFTIQ